MPVSRDVFFDAVGGSARGEAMEWNKRLVAAIELFVYEFGSSGRPIVQAQAQTPTSNPTQSGTSGSSDSDKEGPELPPRPPAPLY